MAGQIREVGSGVCECVVCMVFVMVVVVKVIKVKRSYILQCNDRIVEECEILARTRSHR